MDQAKDSGCPDYNALSVMSGYPPAPNGNPHLIAIQGEGKNNIRD